MTTLERTLLGAAAATLMSISGAMAQGEKPQYGGTLEVGTQFATLSALSWDPHDWNWKLNHDTGQFYEQLIAGDLDKSVRKGGKHKFILDAYLPSDAIRGEIAEKWVWETPGTLAVTLRKGLMFPERQGVMKSRELTREILDQAPYVWLPIPYVYTAWWPWVKNYGGELRAGAVRPGPIYARLWIDQDLKKRLGY